MHNHLCILLYTSTNNYFVKHIMCSGGPFTSTLNLQITDSFHGMHDALKADWCTCGWNPTGETSTCL
jgi:hypothetical protein